MEKLFNKIKSFFIKPKEKELSLEEAIKRHVEEENEIIKPYITNKGPIIFPGSNRRIPGYIVMLTPFVNRMPDSNKKIVLIGKLKNPTNTKPELGELAYNRKGECINTWLNDEWRKRLSLTSLYK